MFKLRPKEGKYPIKNDYFRALGSEKHRARNNSLFSNFVSKF